MSRRQFLAGVGAGAATSLANGSAWLPPAHALSGLHCFDSLGLPSAGVRDKAVGSMFRVGVINDEISQDFGRACEVAAREFGLKWIELRGMWGKNVLNLDSNQVTEAQRILKNCELRVTDIASPLFKVDWPGAPKSQYGQRDEFKADYTFKQQPEVLERAIETAKLFETDRVRCFDFWRLPDPKPHRAAINEHLRDAAARSAAHGITLLLENEEACNTSTAAEATLVLEDVKSPYLMLNWDPANAVASGERAYPDGYDRLPKERIGHCHCKDAIRRGKEYEWEAMGQGLVDWVGQFRALKRDGYRYALSLETHWNGGGTPEQCSRKSWAGMKELLQKVETP